MNCHGFLNASTEHRGNYGYPACFALWNPDIPPPNKNILKTGDQFVFNPNATLKDTTCKEERVSPVLTFQAHMAPLDLKFLSKGTEAFVSFHGSWGRTNPIGYKVVSIDFTSGFPTAASDSMTAATDIFTNADNSACPDNCFRPVGLALDSKDRLLVSSDATGELYVLAKTETATSTTGMSGKGTSATSPTATKEGVADRNGIAFGVMVVGVSVWVVGLMV